MLFIKRFTITITQHYILLKPKQMRVTGRYTTEIFRMNANTQIT
jgi:hypothetical protein